jgi:hypothetical protein
MGFKQLSRCAQRNPCATNGWVEGEEGGTQKLSLRASTDERFLIYQNWINRDFYIIFELKFVRSWRKWSIVSIVVPEVICIIVGPDPLARIWSHIIPPLAQLRHNCVSIPPSRGLPQEIQRNDSRVACDKTRSL